MSGSAREVLGRGTPPNSVAAATRPNDYRAVIADIVHCPHDQGRMDRRHDGQLVCGTCATPFTFRGVVADITRGEDHLITAEMETELPFPRKEAATALYRSVFSAGIERSGLSDDDLRVLEVGTGRGVLSYGCLEVKTPRTYLATDIYPALMNELYPRLVEWSTPRTQVAVGTLDAIETLNIRPGSINLVQGKGVLHHILDYTRFLVACSRVLDKPGAIIFTEPMFDGWLYFLSMVQLIEHLDERKALKTPLGAHARKRLKQRRTSLTTKLQSQGDLGYLEQFGDMDKHVFSVRDFDTVARLTGMHWSVIRDPRSIRQQLMRHFKRLAQTPEELEAIEDVVSSTAPAWPNSALFTDLRAGVCFHW